MGGLGSPPPVELRVSTTVIVLGVSASGQPRRALLATDCREVGTCGVTGGAVSTGIP
jgi:hypothetical protein